MWDSLAALADLNDYSVKLVLQVRALPDVQNNQSIARSMRMKTNNIPTCRHAACKRGMGIFTTQSEV
jgi:hypothetical protein